MYFALTVGEFYFTGPYNHFLEPSLEPYLHKAKFYNEESVALTVKKYLDWIKREKPEVHYGKVKVIKVTLET